MVLAVMKPMKKEKSIINGIGFGFLIVNLWIEYIKEF